MKCPACFNELREVRVGSVAVDVCHEGCGGIWFDAFELKRVDQEEEAAGDLLLAVPKDPSVVVDLTRKRECPRCTGVKLHRHFFSARRRVQVDQCPNCAGYWLDAGELAAIRDEMRGGVNVGEVRRAVTSGQVIRYLYEMQTRVQVKELGES